MAKSRSKPKPKSPFLGRWHIVSMSRLQPRRDETFRGQTMSRRKSSEPEDLQPARMSDAATSFESKRLGHALQWS